MIDIVRDIHGPVGQGHEVPMSCVEVPVPPWRLTALGRPIDGEVGRRAVQGSKEPADVDLGKGT